MTSDGRYITLTGSGEPRAIDPTRVYFPFGDGRFFYDCESCGAQCCRGHGYLLGTQREVLIQIQRRPSLRVFLEPCESTAAHYHVHNCAPACFFLDDRGHCQIHTSDGPAAKPETCRLFPFNFMNIVGDYLVVAPHTGLCPLQIAPSGTRHASSRHANLMAELTAGEIGGHVPAKTPLVADVDRLIALERAIVQLSERYVDTPDYAEFLAQQQCLQQSVLPTTAVGTSQLTVGAADERLSGARVDDACDSWCGCS